MDQEPVDISNDFVKKTTDQNRKFLRADLWAEWKIRGLKTDERRGVPHPPLQKPAPPGATLVDLVPPEDFTLGTKPLIEVIQARRSRREFTPDPFTLEEFSFLLWAAQGVHGIVREGKATSRTVPSGGARHPFETHLFIQRVEGIDPGLYRYLSLDHKLCLLESDPALQERVHKACLQPWVQHAAVVFIWGVVPYRSEWRYSFLSHKIIAQETGHLGQNLYLAAESIGAGGSVLGTYDQDAMDAILGLDGYDEFTIYIAAVGKVEGG